MLWVALHFPQLHRQALARGHASPESGREALAAIAVWACGFTPHVSLEPPQDLVAEVGGSLLLLGGVGTLKGKIEQGIAGLGFRAALGFGPTARAALWRARGGGESLEALPVRVLDLGAEAHELLASLGVRTLGELLALPREGVAARLGAGLIVQLERAFGRLPEAREYFVPPARFSARLELPAPVTQVESALFAVRRLLVQLEGFLAARQAGIRRFCLALSHRSRAPTEVIVGLVAPARSAEHFAGLLRERLAQTALAAPVEAIALQAADIETLAGESRNLFADRSAESEQWRRLVERLQARLGHQAVHGLEMRGDHRPERAWVPLFPGKQTIAEKGRRKEKGSGLEEIEGRPRPLWLLQAPQRIEEGGFVPLAGPERIESGWWDGADARRDYFIVRMQEGSLGWVYREHGNGWFLHGFFA